RRATPSLGCRVPVGVVEGVARAAERILHRFDRRLRFVAIVAGGFRVIVTQRPVVLAAMRVVAVDDAVVRSGPNPALELRCSNGVEGVRSEGDVQYAEDRVECAAAFLVLLGLR